MLNHQLHRPLPPVFIDVEPIGDFDLLNRLVRPDPEVDVEGNGIQQHRTIGGEQHEFQVFFTDDALADHLENAVENRLGEMLAPGAGEAQGGGELQVEIVSRPVRRRTR